MQCHHHKQLKNVEVVEEKHEQIDNNNKQKEINLRVRKTIEKKTYQKQVNHNNKNKVGSK